MGRFRYEYNKLVRNRIPENIEKTEGRSCSYRILDEDAFIHELNRKVIEEAYEFIENDDIGELGDLLEVISEIMRIKKYSREDVLSAMAKKREEKGDFSYRIFLEYVEESSINEEENAELKKEYREKIPN